MSISLIYMKQKTVKSLAKRFKKTRRGLILKRRAGQDHFNAKESGKIVRKKRNDLSTDKTLAQNIKKLI